MYNMYILKIIYWKEKSKSKREKEQDIRINRLQMFQVVPMLLYQEDISDILASSTSWCEREYACLHFSAFYLR